MSVSLATDVQQEGESGPLATEPCCRGKGSPQPQAPMEGGVEGQEPDDGSLHDAQVRRHGDDGETGEEEEEERAATVLTVSMFMHRDTMVT